MGDAALVKEYHSGKGANTMNGTCDFCDQPANGKQCSFSGCDQEMCDAHTHVKFAATIQPLGAGDAQDMQPTCFCEEHKDRANT
jgi:hypothetical protein